MSGARLQYHARDVREPRSLVLRRRPFGRVTWIPDPRVNGGSDMDKASRDTYLRRTSEGEVLGHVHRDLLLCGGRAPLHVAPTCRRRTLGSHLFRGTYTSPDTTGDQEG